MNKKYNIIDKRERCSTSELIEYTIEELKEAFKCNEEDFPIQLKEELENVEDIFDLENYLKNEYAGMEVPYIFMEVE